MLFLHMLILGALAISNTTSTFGSGHMLNSTQSLTHSAASAIMDFVKKNGYAGILVAMIFESASIPVPSEVVLPLVGILSYEGYFNIYYALLVIYISSFVGMAIDYYIGYYLGKDFVFSHLDWFHLKRRTLISFNRWFAANGAFAVFICRCLPVVRGIISFPAGFARMDQKKFFVYSMAGSIIWDSVLTMFGYYELSATTGSNFIIAVSVFAIVLYLIYVEIVKKRISRS